MAIEKDITIDCGADYRQVITLMLENGSPMLLGGCRIRTQCRSKVTDPVILWDFDTDTSTLEVGDGFVAFTVSKAMSDGIQAAGHKKGFWDLELTGPNNLTTRIVQGRVNFSFQVTRD